MSHSLLPWQISDRQTESSSRFPYSEFFQLGAQRVSAQKIFELMSPLLSVSRQKKIDEIVAGRTYDVIPVLENIYDRGNTSAVMRSCEAMGYQSLHLIEPNEKFKKSQRVTKGADKWLDVVRWTDSTECVHGLKKMGYRVYATHFEQATPIGEVDFTQPTALVFGNEKDGVSDEILSQVDGRVVIPMQGFVQSFNISVAAAIALYHAYRDRIMKLGFHGNLTIQQREILRALYFLRSSKNPERLIRKLLERENPPEKL